MNTISASLPLTPVAMQDLQSASSPRDRELTGPANGNVGEQFEAVFMSMVLKQMRQSFSGDEGGLFAGDSSDTYGGLFDMFMGQHLASSGTLGIAGQINTYAERSQASHE